MVEKTENAVDTGAVVVGRAQRPGTEPPYTPQDLADALVGAVAEAVRPWLDKAAGEPRRPPLSSPRCGRPRPNTAAVSGICGVTRLGTRPAR